MASPLYSIRKPVSVTLCPFRPQGDVIRHSLCATSLLASTFVPAVGCVSRHDDPRVLHWLRPDDILRELRPRRAATWGGVLAGATVLGVLAWGRGETWPLALARGLAGGCVGE